MKYFKNAADLPRFTKLGFEVIDLPDEIKNLLFDFYELLKPQKRKEEWKNIQNSIYDENKQASVDFFDVEIAPHWARLLEKKIQPLMEDWIKHQEELMPFNVYGIRSYNKGMHLGKHYDRTATHHVSGIVIIDRDGENWPLDIQGHDGNWYKVYAEPGQMIFYESAVCEHGRLSAFKGNYFRNCLFHYSLKNWTYVGSETWTDYINKLVGV
jgi:hypothetical protein